MNILAGIIAAIADKLLGRIISAIKAYLVQKAEEKKEKAEEVAYDKQVQDALNKYKESKDAKAQEDAFINLINSARRH